MTGMARFRLLHICNTMDRINGSAKNQYKRNQCMLGWLTWCWRLPRSGSGWRSSSPSPGRRRSRSWCGACCSEWPPWPRCQTRRGPSWWRSRHRRSWPCRSRCPWGAEPRSLAAAGATPWCPSSPRGPGPKQSIAPRQAPRPPRIGSPPCRCRDRVGWRRKKKECMIGSAAGLGYCVKGVGNLRRFGIQSVSWMSWPGENQEIYSKTNKLIGETPRRRRRRGNCKKEEKDKQTTRWQKAQEHQLFLQESDDLYAKVRIFLQSTKRKHANLPGQGRKSRTQGDSSSKKRFFLGEAGAQRRSFTSAQLSEILFPASTTRRRTTATNMKGRWKAWALCRESERETDEAIRNSSKSTWREGILGKTYILSKYSIKT